MKLLICGDLHLTDKCPSNRKDDYENTVLRKFTFILNTANEQRCKAILLPGDVFDTPTPSYRFFARVLSILDECLGNIRVLTVYGQHDMKYRTTDNTALNTLRYANNSVRILDREGWVFDKVCFTGCSWNEELIAPVRGYFNVLLTHRMLVDKKIWEGQEHFEYADVFLKNHKFDLIVSGDNHKYFYVGNKRNRSHLFNCGSMMRSTISQLEHKPVCILFDTDSPDDWKSIPIPIETTENVFKMDEIVSIKERNSDLASFIEGLSNQKEMGLNFQSNLLNYIKENNLNPDIYELIKEGMNE